MKSLVTGGCGFIGSNLVDCLVELGHEVVVIDNHSSDAHFFNKLYPFTNENVEYHKFDICDYFNTRLLYEGVDYVFHLAAEVRIPSCIEDPVKAIRTNDLGTCTVLQCSRDAKVRKVIYSSTSAVYGLKNELPNVETQPDDCLNPYSVSKLNGERLCKMYTDLFELPTVMLRYFNVYGERQPRSGQYAPVIGIFEHQKLSSEPLSICGDGKQSRDFVHVSDVVNANVMAAISNSEPEAYGEVYNVGSGVSYTVNQIADMMSDFQCNIAPRKGEARESLANVDKIHEAFGWRPKVNLIEWMEKNHGKK